MGEIVLVFQVLVFLAGMGIVVWEILKHDTKPHSSKHD